MTASGYEKDWRRARTLAHDLHRGPRRSGSLAHGAPWIFKQARAALDGLPDPGGPSVSDRFRICLEHARNTIAFEHNSTHAVLDFRKHLGWYTKGLPNGRELRTELFQVTAMHELEDRLEDYRARFLSEMPV